MRGLPFRSVDNPLLWSQGLLNVTGSGSLRAYIDQKDSLAMPKDGGTFTGPVVLAYDALTPMAPTTLRQVQDLIASGAGSGLASKVNKAGDTMTGPLRLPSNSNIADAAVTRGDVANMINGVTPVVRVYDFSNSGFNVTLFNENPPRTKIDIALRAQDLPNVLYPNGSVFGTNVTGSLLHALELLQAAIVSAGGAQGTMAQQNANNVNITGGNISGVTLSGTFNGTATNVTGVVAVANGGTGVSTLTGYVKGNGTGAMTASATIPASDLSGTVSLAKGGTGATTQAAALTNLLPAQTGQSGKALVTNGTSASWQSVSGLTNPMTAVGDVIIGSTAGAAARLAIGTTGQVLTVVGGVPAWSTPSSGFVNPMSAAGDLIRGGTSGAATRIAAGTNGQVLMMVGGVPAWATSPTGGMANPMTAVGDLIRGGASGAATRVAAGTEGQRLTMVSGVPTWVTPTVNHFTDVQFAISGMDYDLETGVRISYLRVMRAGTFTSLRASLGIASSSGLVTIQVYKNGVAMLSTPLTIDATELTSMTAATPFAWVNGANTVAVDDEISVSVTSAGTGARGLILSLIAA